jgi:hypothetical protein
MYQRDRATFDQTARFWTECYARPKAAGEEEVCMHMYACMYVHRISIHSESPFNFLAPLFDLRSHS